MYRRVTAAVMPLVFCLAYMVVARVAEAARPGPLTCHKVECPMPGPCQVRESDRCLHGGGPPRCPGVVDAPDGTSCNDASICTTVDVCTAGACAGSPLVCESDTDTCEPASGCATDCGPLGCTVLASGTDGMLTVPPGALAADVRISIVFQGSDPSDPSVFQVYSLNPHPTQFATPATLNLPAPPLAAGQIAVIDLNDGTGWVEIPTTLTAGRVTGPISHFSSCRTRAKAPDLTEDLNMFDMVEFQDVVNILNPNGLLYPPGCVPGVSCCEPGSSLFGICFTVENTTMGTIPSATVRIFPWQCYNSSVILDWVDPVTNEYEGEHCLSTSLLIPCGFVDVAVPLPAGGLAPGEKATVKYDFEGSPVHSCLGSSFVGVDVTLREPIIGDTAAGMRSAKDGPFVNGGLFQGIFPRDPADNSKVNGNGRRIKNFLIDARF